MGEGDVEQRLDHEADRVVDRGAWGKGALLAQAFVEDHQEEFALGGRVPEQGAGPNIRGLRDLRGGDGIEAAFLEEVRCGREDAVLLLRLVAFPAADRPCAHESIQP